jgi:hypothetical protein
VTADCGWKRSFDDPIPLSRGRQFVTLQDAGHYIIKLPINARLALRFASGLALFGKIND